MIFPYLFFGTIALLVAFRLKDVKVDTASIQLRDVRRIFHNKSFVIFLFLMLFLTIIHRSNDSFIGLYITELGGRESLVGLGWFDGVVSLVAIFGFAVFWFCTYYPFIFIITYDIDNLYINLMT